MESKTLRGLAAVLCLGLLVGVLGASQNIDDNVAKADSFQGVSSGSWNSPAHGSPGYAFGIWTPVGGGSPLFLMNIETVATSPDGLSGTFEGVLNSFPLSPLGQPWAAVGGVYHILDESTGKGVFEGIVTTYLPNPLMGAPIQLLGQLQGRFVDPLPPTPHAPDVIGQYRMRWELF